MSLALAADGLGGAVVAWNEIALGSRAAHVQHFDRNGAPCADIRLSGSVTDLIVRADGHVVAATNQSIFQLSL